MIGSQFSSIPQYLEHSHGTCLNVILFETYFFLNLNLNYKKSLAIKPCMISGFKSIFIKPMDNAYK